MEPTVKVEPDAEMRRIAANLMQMFTAYTDAGFTDQQALEIVKVWVAEVVVER